VSRIEGRDRVEAVEVTPLEDGRPAAARAFRVPCDTVLLSVGLVPENELSRAAGVPINEATAGPWVDAALMTRAEGVFACGNVLHVHDLVDFVSEESRRCGQAAAAWLARRPGDPPPPRALPLSAGANVRYVVPNAWVPGAPCVCFLRPLVVKNDAFLEVSVDGRPARVRRLPHVQPSEMVRFVLEPGSPEVHADSSSVEVAVR
jgi:hypothetical protein